MCPSPFTTRQNGYPRAARRERGRLEASLVSAARATLNLDTLTMSDEEHDVETFESADAGASHTVPMQAGSVRKNGFMVRSRRRPDDDDDDREPNLTSFGGRCGGSRDARSRAPPPPPRGRSETVTMRMDGDYFSF